MNAPSSLAAVALGIASALVASPASGQSSPCTGSLSGAVSASFTCSVVATQQDGKVVFRVTPEGSVAGVRSLAGAIEVAAPLAMKTYTRADLAGSSATVITTDGEVFRAMNGSPPEGELLVSIEQLEREAAGTLLAVGAVRTSLVPKPGTKGTVSMEIRFTTTW